MDKGERGVLPPHTGENILPSTNSNSKDLVQLIYENENVIG